MIILLLREVPFLCPVAKILQLLGIFGQDNMEAEDKYFNIYHLDLSDSSDTFVRKLTDINIFVTGDTKNVLLLLICSNSEKDIENYRAAFNEHDEDGSGNISTEGSNSLF